MKGYDGLPENDPWANNVVSSPISGFGEMNEARAKYSSAAVVETIAEGQTKLSWTPVVVGSVKVVAVDGTETAVSVDADGTLGSEISVGDKVKYLYDNQYIPQEKLPTLVGRMRGIALTARARRIAVYYSQFAAFQSKQDYGMDFEATIAQQAQAELQYEIDGEAVLLVKKTADAVISDAEVITWRDTELDTISYSMKAEGFARVLEQAKAVMFKKTGRWMPNWILVGPEVMPILSFVKGFQPAANTVVNGPYIAGTVGTLKVIVSPVLGKECYLGVLGADGKTATGVYSPYMPIVPTQLLGFADGTMAQGFSTLYDMRIINPALLGKIAIETVANEEFPLPVNVVDSSL